MEKVEKSKKKWYDIITNESFGTQLIGRSIVDDTKLLIGKTINANAMTLTNDMKKQHINLKFKVSKIAEGKGQADLVDYEVMPAALRRFVRRGKDRIDMSFVAKTSDGVNVRVKPMMLTRTLTSGSVRTALRHATEDQFLKTVKTLSYDDCAKDLVSYKLQTTMKGAVNKIYPLKVLEVKHFIRLV